MIGVHRVTLYKWMADGAFPASVKIGRNSTRWRAEAVEAWLDSLEAA